MTEPLEKILKEKGRLEITLKVKDSCSLSSIVPRYNCFVCDVDICLECTTVLERRRLTKRARTHRSLLWRNRRVSVTSVVCLKTLCDKVAQIELDNQRQEVERRKVSVGVNTTDSEEDVSSECPTLVERETVLEAATPTEPEPEELAVCESQAEVYHVDVHLPTGDWSSPARGEKVVQQHRKPRTTLIDQIKLLNGVETPPQATSNSCSLNLKDQPQPTSLLSRLRLDGESLSSMSASPDIFHLRAPLVSWENFLTPSLTEDSTLAEF